MKKLLILILLVIANVCIAQTNINISNTAGWDTEPYIAVNPSNPNNIVAAWMRLSGFTLAIGTSYSNDGGTTWSSPTTIPHLYPAFTMADVSLTFGTSGKVYMTFIDYETTLDSGYVMITKSINGGATWSTPVKVLSGLASPDKPIDRPWVAIDNSGGIYDGRIYVVSKSVDIGAMPHHIWMEYSADDGVTWSSQILVDDSIPSNLITNSMGVPTVGADGSLYIAYMSYDPPSSPFPRIVCLKSTTGGTSFTPYIIGYPVAGSGMTDTLYQGSYTLSANPVAAGNIIFTFTDNRNGDPDILSVRSFDGGEMWTTTPVRINDDALSNGVGQDMSWAVFTNTGKYIVAWRDRRNTGGTSSSPFEMLTTFSFDGGASFKPNYNVSSIPSPFINIQKGNDFIGICADDNYIYSDWCDMRTGNTEIFVNKTPMTVFSVEENNANRLKLNVFPNPTSDNATLVFMLKEKQFLKITLTDVNGRQLKTISSQNFNEGEQKLQIATLDLSAGSYLLNVVSDKNVVVSTTLLKVER